MKIYTHSDKVGKTYGVGVVLVGDLEQEYMYDFIPTDSTNEVGATLVGIKRAMSFAKANKLLYCDSSKVEIFNKLEDKNKGIIRHLKHNPTFKSDYNYSTSEQNEEDVNKYRLGMCVSKIQVQQRHHYALNYKKYKDGKYLGD